MRSKLVAFILSFGLCMSLTPAAVAVPDDLVDAKDDIATVDIVQTCNEFVGDKQTHNYATDGSEVEITYSATLQMTEEMAIYLTARQTQLLDGKFNTRVMVDATDDRDTLEFAGDGEYLTVVFASSFLKPWDVAEDDIRTYPDAFGGYKEDDYNSELIKVEDGLFYYEISVKREWAQNRLDDTCCVDIPMELILYYDGTDAYGYEDLFDAQGRVLEEFEDQKPLFFHYTEADWMKAVKITVGQLRVKDEVPDTVTYDSGTWRRVIVGCTVDGEFTYEKAQDIISFRDYNYANTNATTNTLEFGNDFATDGEEVLEEWTSDEVWVYLIRFASTPGGGNDPDPDDPTPDSPFLDQENHFAYVIGKSDGLVHPEATITRAEVATIFFRMLTDKVREEFWCQTNPYGDVDLDDWYNNAVSTLSNMGVIYGKPDGDFHPYDNISRGEFATMAVRFFLITEDLYAEVTEDAFSDIASHWANEYINMAYLLELVNGLPDGTFQPNKEITRAEAMTLVNNTLRRTPYAPGMEEMEARDGYITWPDNMDKNKWYYAAVQEATNSHEYTLVGGGEHNGKEYWVNILPVRDWAAFEKAWSDANSAVNPGEVVDGE